MKQILEFLKKNHACNKGYKWSLQFDNPQEWWDGFERGDWMLWVIGKAIKSICDRKKLVITACQCARLALPYIRKGESRPLKAIETAEAWANNADGVTIEDVRAAACAATAAADAAIAAAYAAACAAIAAADAAAAAYADDAAADATYAAADTTYAAYAADAAKKDVQKKTAEIVRGNYLVDDVLNLIKKVKK